MKINALLKTGSILRQGGACLDHGLGMIAAVSVDVAVDEFRPEMYYF